MGTFMAAAAGPPGILFTAGLGVIVCFWLLVAVRAMSPDSFDSDVDLGPWGMRGVPVAVAITLLTLLAWLFSAGASVLLTALAPPGTAAAVLRLVAPVGALFVSWRLTCLFVRPLHRLFPKEPEAPASAADVGDSCADLTSRAHERAA